MKTPEYIEYEDGTRILLDEDDAPELDDDFFAHAVPFSQAHPELHASWKQGRGRPRKADAKRKVMLRIDPDVLEGFKAHGKGWQTQMNAALRDWITRHPV
jgi:uncharacterized protein (DUF4415 family)